MLNLVATILTSLSLEVVVICMLLDLTTDHTDTKDHKADTAHHYIIDHKMDIGAEMGIIKMADHNTTATVNNFISY